MIRIIVFLSPEKKIKPFDKRVTDYEPIVYAGGDFPLWIYVISECSYHTYGYARSSRANGSARFFLPDPTESILRECVCCATWIICCEGLPSAELLATAHFVAISQASALLTNFSTEPPRGHQVEQYFAFLRYNLGVMLFPRCCCSALCLVCVCVCVCSRKIRDSVYN